MINEWLAIMYSHGHTCNALFDFYFFFSFVIYLGLWQKLKKTKIVTKSLSLW